MLGGNVPAESGVTVAGKKRRRDPLSFFGEDLSSYFQQHILDLDRLVAHTCETMRVELTERRRRFSQQLTTTLEEGIRKRVRAKEEEIERVKKMNWAMEDRIRSLCIENQIWRELAQTNEATANLLRTNLEQILAAQIRIKEEQQQQLCDGAAPVDDAESCCCGGNDDREPPAAAAAAAAAPAPGRVCRICEEREPSVLLLPCRHLCLCAACAPMINACPICNFSKKGSVNVNLS